MKKQTLCCGLLIFLLAGFSSIATAQIANADFESWDSLRCNNADPVVPVGWQTTCSFPLGFFSGFEQTTDAYSGSYAAKLTPSGFGDFVFYSGPSYLQTSLPYDAYPASLNGYYKYSTDSIGDSAMVMINVFEFDQNLSSYDTLFIDTLKLGPVSSYTGFTFNIPAIASAAWQDSIEIIFISDYNSDSTSFPGYEYSGVLIVDSVWLDDIINAVPEDALQKGFSIFPNPSDERVTLTLPEQTTEVSICDFRGRLLKQWLPDAVTRSVSFDISELPRGVYLVTIISGNERMNRKLMKI